jgi:hypothetical protein
MNLGGHIRGSYQSHIGGSSKEAISQKTREWDFFQHKSVGDYLWPRVQVIFCTVHDNVPHVSCSSAGLHWLMEEEYRKGLMRKPREAKQSSGKEK